MFGRNASAIEPEMGFADIHTHILPGVDDGARNMQEAMALLRLAYENGTKTIFLTPHYRGQYRKNSPELLRENFSALCQMAQQEFPKLKLYLGSEVHFEQDAPDGLLAGQILSMNGNRYCLLEFRGGALRSRIITGVSMILNSGYIPIIAHVERYDAFLQDKTLVDEVLRMGARIQLNAGSVLGTHGWAVSAFCRRLLKTQKVHFIATDSHDAEKRPPLLRVCFQKVSQKYGREYALALFSENACLVAGDHEI